MKSYILALVLTVITGVSLINAAVYRQRAEYWRKQYDAAKSQAPCHAVIDCEASTGKCQTNWTSAGATAATIIINPPVETPIVTIPESTEQTDLKRLREEAHKRGLKWYIHCFGDEFAGRADRKGTNIAAIYIEDGAKPDWFVTGPTEAKAVHGLLEAIQGPPNIIPDHRPIEKPPKHCPPELSGD